VLSSSPTAISLVLLGIARCPRTTGASSGVAWGVHAAKGAAVRVKELSGQRETMARQPAIPVHSSGV